MTELSNAVGAPAPWAIPRWTLRPFVPFGEIFIAETSIRASNTRDKTELGWAPYVPTYRQGIKMLAQALMNTYEM